MKHKHSEMGQSGFWVKLVAVLVAVGIVVVLVFSGVQRVLSQITDLQQNLDTKRIELNAVSGQMAEAHRELEEKFGELESAQNELAATSNELEQTAAQLADTAGGKGGNRQATK